MKRLYFLRHGLSELNVAGLFAGSTDTPLTKEGRQKALEAGQKAKGTDIDLIISSPLSRALETAKLFCQGAGIDPKIIITNELLVERSFGSLEKTPWSQELSASLMDDNLPEGVEKWSDVRARGKKLLDEIENLNKDNILLVGHGAIGRSIRTFVKPEVNFREGILNSELERWV